MENKGNGRYFLSFSFYNAYFFYSNCIFTNITLFNRYMYYKGAQVIEPVVVSIMTATFGFMSIYINNDCKPNSETTEEMRVQVQIFCLLMRHIVVKIKCVLVAEGLGDSYWVWCCNVRKLSYLIIFHALSLLEMLVDFNAIIYQQPWAVYKVWILERFSLQLCERPDIIVPDNIKSSLWWNIATDRIFS